MDALSAARKVLSSRISDNRIKFVPGLADDLRAIMNAFDEFDRRTSVLAAVVLRKHFWPQSKLTKAQVDALAELGAEPAVVARIAEHGDRCVCSECMPGG